MTQVQIAREAGCVQGTISALLSGKAREPKGSLATSLIAIGKRRKVKAPARILPNTLEPVDLAPATQEP